MPFSAFYGNSAMLTRLREMAGSGRFPHAVILAGGEGSGKYTLAQMLAKTMNCLAPPAGVADFCGSCANCTRIAAADDLDARIAEAVEARDALRETDKKETRILIQTHPEVMIIPPDPPQNMIKIGQVRKVIDSIYFKPVEARRKVFIFSDSAFMKEAANSLLKVLEEPPESATLILLARSTGELLPTIRSRCVTFTLAPVPTAELEAYLAQVHPEWASRQRQLVARLADGAVGKAAAFDLVAYSAARKDAFLLLTSALKSEDHSELFRVTETYRSGGEGRDKTNDLIRAAYSLLEDLLFLKSGTPALLRNTDIAADLQRLANSIDMDWLSNASAMLGRVESGMRRNLLRNLSLDSFAASLER